MLPITPKYSIGASVFAARANYVETKVQCPDCLGEKEVEVHTPSGEVFHAACGLCSYGFFSDGVIRKYVDQPAVERLTVGSVRLNTDDERPISYMCRETGVGSGTVWYEGDLFVDYDEAMAVAMSKAAANAAARQAQEDSQREEQRRKAKRKPSWERRRIRELEMQIKAMQKSDGVAK